MDEIHDEIMNSGRSKMTNKVAGIVVTGDSDGAEHIIGNLANFLISLGFTIPAASILLTVCGLDKVKEVVKVEKSSGSITRRHTFLSQKELLRI